MLEQLRGDAEMENKLINDKVYQLAADPQLKFALPKAKLSVPFLEFSPVENAMAVLKKDTELLKKLLLGADKLDAVELDKLNAILYQAEQKLLSEKGLPRRPWYRHQIYAPGFYTGYGVKTLPGIREGIEEGNWSEAQERIRILATTLTDFDSTIKAASAIFN
jgi:N-acetylated-alpha-linked acidic dipeptidase